MTRTIVLATLALSLALAGGLHSLPLNAVACSDGAPAPFGATQLLEASDHRTVVKVSSDRAVERLTGWLAQEHLRKRMREHPEAFDRSGSSLKELGYSRTDEVVVIRSIRLDGTPTGRTQPARGSGALVTPYRLAQTYSESDSDGEVILVSWDDGNDATWEGETYIERYSDGAWQTWESQANIADEPYTVWEQKTGSGGGTGGGGGGGGDDRIDYRGPRRSPGPLVASLDPVNAVATPQLGGAVLQAQTAGDWATFLWCAYVGCQNGHWRCVGTGPYYFKCRVAWCVGAILGCAFNHLF